MSFDKAWEYTLGHEGGFVDDPKDSGGATRFGITEAVARANGYQGLMSQLSLNEAKRIAKTQYWDMLRLDEVARLSFPIARELFDTSYNMGQATAGRFLQRALNSLNRGGVDYSEVVDDGIIGPATIFSLRAFLRVRGARGESVMMKALNCMQGAAYFEIARRRPKDEEFIFGWLHNRVNL